jgi:serine/threonine-protein kinase
MGVVYLARDEAVGRSVALKVIAPALAADRGFRERFRRESRLAAQVEHPAVVPVYRAGQDQGRLFIAMRFIEGTDLATVLREDGALSPAGAAALVAQIAGALDAAHARGLVHRDVKPANVLLSVDGRRAFLTDFGLTIELDKVSGLTRTGTWVGTLAYVAPEQLRGGAVDARTDVYALGGVLHHCLTGQVPYPVEQELDAISAHLFDPPPRPSAIDSRVPSALDAVVARAMSKDPAARFRSASDLAKATAAAVRGDRAPQQERSVATGAAAPRPLEAAHAPARPARRPRRRLLAGGVAAAAGAALLTVALTVLTGDGTHSGRESPRGAVVAERPLPVAGTPEAVAVVAGAVWTMTVQGGGLQRTDTRTGRSQATPAPVDLGGGEFPALAAGAGALWQVHSAETSGGVNKLDARDGSVLGRAGLPGATAVAADRDDVWATARHDRRGELVRIKPDTAAIARGPVPAGREPVAVVEAGGSIWVADRRGDVVLRYNPRTLRMRARIPVGAGPSALAVADGELWVADIDDRTLTHLDTRTGEVVGPPVGLGKEIQAIAGSAGTLWVAAADATVTRIDPHTGFVRGRAIDVGAPPLSLATDGEDGVWVVSAADGTVQRLQVARGRAS